MYRMTALLVMLLAGCRIGSKGAAAPAELTTASLGTAAPGQFSDLAPGDTAGVIVMMQQIMRGIDAGLGEMSQRDTAFAAGADSVSRHLTAWMQEGVPRKLVVVDSTGHGQNNTETDVWFMGGDVAVILQVTDAYAFDADHIVLWTDEALQPRIDITGDGLMAKQATLIDGVRGWLAALGIKAQ